METIKERIATLQAKEDQRVDAQAVFKKLCEAIDEEIGGFRGLFEKACYESGDTPARALSNIYFAHTQGKPCPFTIVWQPKYDPRVILDGGRFVFVSQIINAWNEIVRPALIMQIEEQEKWFANIEMAYNHESVKTNH